MERIIAGRFETKGIADAAAVLLTQYQTCPNVDRLTGSN
jgi:hypothetical protein